MKRLRRKELPVKFLILYAIFEILYNAASMVYVIALKIHTWSVIHHKITKVKTRLSDLQLHLSGFGIHLSVETIDPVSLEKFINAGLWLFFVLNLTAHATNLVVAVLLHYGVRQKKSKLLGFWILYGLLNLVLLIGLYPLKKVGCGTAEANDLRLNGGSICRPIFGNVFWLNVILTLFYYFSVLLAILIYRKRMLSEKSAKNGSVSSDNEIFDDDGGGGGGGSVSKSETVDKKDKENFEKIEMYSAV